MKKHIWKRGGNRVVIDTGNKTFDRQCDGFHTGNVCANTQFSWFIRPKNETECNDFHFPIGHLRNVDLAYFKNLPNHVREKIEELTENKSVILYEIRHFIRKDCSDKKIIHGYIATRGSSENNVLLLKYPCYNFKSERILDIAIEYLT